MSSTSTSPTRMTSSTKLIAAATGGQGRTGSVNQLLARALAHVHRRLRPWHVYVLLAASLLSMVLAIVLVHVCNQHEKDTSTTSDQSTARVNLGYAQYQGTVLGNGVAQYLGLRFAQAPTGSLRWKAPLEPERVAGDQAANAYGKVCLGISAPLPNAAEDEDCLFVNVWAPANATSDSKLPVWLFIQGGGYTINSNDNWNGSYLVETSSRNMVFVNFNYRVGLYGFLASERVRADGDLNVGLLDQRRVLQWVQDHISQFGGDPGNVIIQGVSAGAGSVAHHLTAYGGTDENLFRGAIAESVFFPAQPEVSELEWQFDRLLAQTGCTGAAEPMSCLRGKDLTTLQAANVPTPFPGMSAAPLPLFYWGPCIDGNLSRESLYAAFDSGAFIDVPVIFGTVNDEGSYFGINAATSTEVAIFFQNNYPHLNSSQTVDIINTYPLEASVAQHAPWFPSASKAYGEATFICPSLHILSAIQAKHDNDINSSSSDSSTSTISSSSSSVNPKAWSFRYNVLAAANYALGLGVPHAWETWAVFGPDSINGVGGAPPSYYGADAAIVPVVMNYWISFVRTLDPNVLRYASAPEWLTWDQGEGQQSLRFETNNVTMETTASDVQSRCAFWKTLASTTEQ